MDAIKYKGRLYIPATKSHTVGDVVDVDALVKAMENLIDLCRENLPASKNINAYYEAVCVLAEVKETL